VTRALATLVAALALAAPAHAATTAGITVRGTLPEPGVVSAKPVGDLLYVSGLTGISVYDVSDPVAPRRIGRLDLPHVQNEDVDVAGGILLVTDDPYGGRGVLHVVDVRDPTQPRLLSTYDTWTPGLLDDLGPTRRRRGGIGHTASCLQDCRYAWLAGSPDGIEVVDLRDPARPRFAGRVRATAAAGISTHDVQVDPQEGLAWVTGGAGTAAYDVRDPVRPRLRYRTDRRGGRGPWNDFIHHNSQRLSKDVVAITEEDLRPRCEDEGTIQTWRIRGSRMVPLARFGVERDDTSRVICSAHYFDARDGLLAAGFYEQGLRLVDVSDPRRLVQVGVYEASPAMVWGALFAPTDPTGSTLYVVDHARGIDVVTVDRTALEPVRVPPVRRRGAQGALDVGAFVDDGLEVARPGTEVTFAVAAGRSTGPAARGTEVELTLGPGYEAIRPPRGATLEGNVVRWRIDRLRQVAVRRVRARVSRSARRGQVLEAVAWARTPGDVLPVSDRSVDRGRVGRRTVRTESSFRPAAAIERRRLLCLLPPS
jgi:hypothetical protein